VTSQEINPPVASRSLKPVGASAGWARAVPGRCRRAQHNCTTLFRVVNALVRCPLRRQDPHAW